MGKKILTKINLDEIKVGDIVGVPHNCSIGLYKNFRNPLVSKETITKISPKRTKFTMNKGEYSINGNGLANTFVKYDDEAIASNESAENFEKLKILNWGLETMAKKGKFSIKDLSDEDILQCVELLEKIKNKYVKEPV